MRLTLTVLLVATLGLSACASIRDSRVNPANWFGNARSEPRPVQTQAERNPLIPREEERVGLFSNVIGLREDEEYFGAPIDQVTDLVIEPLPGGAIIRATGVTAYDGVYGIRLTPVNPDDEAVDGVLTYRLEGVRPDRLTRSTPPQVRTVTAARHVTDRQLAEARTIRVEAVRNAQVTSRGR